MLDLEGAPDLPALPAMETGGDLAARSHAADAMPHGRGATLDDDPFNSAFAGADGAPALGLDLDLEFVAVQRQPPPEQAAASPPCDRDAEPASDTEPEQSPQQGRARRMREIASYGPPPDKLYRAPAYSVRVMLRKRVLMEELAALSMQRKRADDMAGEALAKLAESLYALQGDPRLGELSRQIAAVADAEAQVGSVEAQSRKRRQELEREIARLDPQIARRQEQAAPLRARESELAASADPLKARIGRIRARLKKLDAEIEAARAKSGGAAERSAALETERAARHDEAEALAGELRPLAEDLARVRGALGKLERASSALAEQKRIAVIARDRVDQNQRVSSGSAKGARRHALLSLAKAGRRAGLGELVPEEEREAAETAARADECRAQEELHRAAAQSYDHTAYTQGLTILLGGSGALFLVLAMLVLL